MHRSPSGRTLVDLGRTTLRTWGWGDPADPLVLCLHGAYDHGRMFDGLAPRLAALGYHVVAVDFRGHGDSGPLDTGFAWALIHLDLALLIRHLGGGPVGIVAHSFGGGQATGVAGAFPELVRWIVNIDGLGPPAAALVPPDQIPDAVRRSFEPHRPGAAGRRAAVGVGRGDGGLPRSQQPAAAAGVGHAPGPPRRPPGARAAGCGRPIRCSASASRASSTWPCSRPRCATCSCPVLVLTGDQEDTWRELDRGGARGRVAWLGARHAVVPGTGHYVHIEDPDATMAHIEAFLDEVGP